MKLPFIRRPRTLQDSDQQEKGVTILLVALAMVAIVAMAALSIDVITLYLAREEAQRSADAAALAAARVLALSGVTGDPGNIQGGLPGAPWPAACTLASQVGQAVANQNAVSSAAPSSVTVTFLYNGVAVACSAAAGNAGFGLNPQVQVQVVRQGLPTFFSRIWRGGSTNSVSGAATAEAFNSSNSGSVASGGIVPVNPRCVKPWIVPNRDPGNSGNPFVNLTDGSITSPGIRLSGAGTGVIGESFTLAVDCKSGADCKPPSDINHNPPTATPPSSLDYVPALVSGSPPAYTSCADDSPYEQAIGGCDQESYACGTPNGFKADLTMNPGGGSGHTALAAECLINEPSANGTGQDTLDTSVFPYQIHAGSANPIIKTGVITSSTSIVTVPIYDDTPGAFSTNQPQVTIVGFLQLFIDNVDSNGNVAVHVLNVSGCSKSALAAAVNGSSPVPVRLITPP